MSNSIDSSESVSITSETRLESNHRAVIDTMKCTASGECIQVCEVNAIYEGPGRIPAMICCATVELDPGKSVVNQDKCTGCGDCISVCPSHAIEMVLVAHE